VGGGQLAALRWPLPVVGAWRAAAGKGHAPAGRVRAAWAAGSRPGRSAAAVPNKHGAPRLSGRFCSGHHGPGLGAGLPVDHRPRLQHARPSHSWVAGASPDPSRRSEKLLSTAAPQLPPCAAPDSSGGPPARAAWRPDGSGEGSRRELELARPALMARFPVDLVAIPFVLVGVSRLLPPCSRSSWALWKLRQALDTVWSGGQRGRMRGTTVFVAVVLATAFLGELQRGGDQRGGSWVPSAGPAAAEPRHRSWSALFQ
jgi:hypothetical protein